jgi:hypothetical protein
MCCKKSSHITKKNYELQKDIHGLQNDIHVLLKIVCVYQKWCSCTETNVNVFQKSVHQYVKNLAIKIFGIF